MVTQLESQTLDQYLLFLEQAILGGITSVQYRDKKNGAAAAKEIAATLKTFLSSFQIPLIINDNVQLAEEIDADGVHLGQSDGCPVEARKTLGPDKLIGWSVETQAHLEHANQMACIDYIAASPVFPTNSKFDCKPAWGLEGLKQLAQHSKHPVIGIGGINLHNVHEVMQHGASGIAIIGAIHHHPDPQQAATTLLQAINLGKTDNV